jgi:Protein of unknown function (DUF1501)
MKREALRLIYCGIAAVFCLAMMALGQNPASGHAALPHIPSVLFGVNQYNVGPPELLAKHWPLNDDDAAYLKSLGCNTIRLPLYPSEVGIDERKLVTWREDGGFDPSVLPPPGASLTYRVTVGSGPLASSATASLLTPARSPKSMPDEAYANTRDFGMLWWRDGVRGARVWCVKTSRYTLGFDADTLSLITIFPHSTRADEAATLVEENSVSIPASAPASTLACQFIGNGGTHPVQAYSTNLDDSHLVENGRFYQRRWQKVKTAAGPALNDLQSGLEVCAWPDRVSFVLRLIPTAAVTKGQMNMTLNLADVFGTLTSSGAMQALARSDGSGFAFVKSAGTTALSIDAATATVTVQTETGAWNASEERSCGFVVYPLASVAANLARVVQGEAAPLTITATQTLPVVGDAARPVVYDVDRGFHQITLRHNGTTDDRVELTRVTIANPTATAREVRLNFAKGSPVAQINGVTCILRDDDGNPCGIPVQLSKNWHTEGDERWEGPWFHGLTMLTVPAATTLDFEVLLVGHHYGGVPAASHAQLSLIGWGHHQAWDEAAIGDYGEQFCYEPDGDQVACFGTDSRPLLLLSTAGLTKQWTGNFGGCDFLRFFNTNNQHQRHRRVRTMYQRYGPALTDVTYAAELSNGAMSGTYSASIARSADFSRAFHRFRFEATSNVSFNRLVFFQLAADTYNYACGTAHSQGNAESVTPARQWTATFGSNADIAPVTALSGRSAWFYTADGPTPGGYRAANRGYILRCWQARIGGVDGVAPHYVERSLSAVTGARENGSAIDLVPPPGVTSLQAGDYVEGEIERVIHPRDAADYYGPDTAFQTALATYANTPGLMLREAIGNDLVVNVTTGALERSYPVQVRAAQGVAEFSITRGVGYVPITITGLSDYRSPVLEENVGGTWTAIDQATAGKDFWQCDFNAANTTWDITFNVKMDAAFQSNADLLNAPVTRTFRYRQAATTTSAGAPVQVTVNLTKEIKKNRENTDQANAPLVKDLKQRRLLNDTLVVRGGEFGRAASPCGSPEPDSKMATSTARLTSSVLPPLKSPSTSAICTPPFCTCLASITTSSPIATPASITASPASKKAPKSWRTCWREFTHDSSLPVQHW